MNNWCMFHCGDLPLLITYSSISHNLYPYDYFFKHKIIDWIFYLNTSAGQEKYRTVTSSYYRTANGILVVFDLTNRKSYDDVGVWLDEIDKYASPKVLRILVGNKQDLDSERVVMKKEAQKFAEEKGTKENFLKKKNT